MTDTRDQFHERESQVAPPVRSGEAHAAAFDKWWKLSTHNGTLPEHRQSLAREAYYAAWGGACPDMLAALKIFLGDDDRFQVAVGGNPLAVDRMLDGIRALVDKAEGRS